MKAIHRRENMPGNNNTISFPEKKIFFGGQRKIDENKNPLFHGNYTTQV